MKLVIEIHMNNAGFEPYPLGECSRILKELAQKMYYVYDQTAWDSKLHDTNGNCVGAARVVSDKGTSS
jgi:hypothetical protein